MKPLVIIDPGHGGMLDGVYQTVGKQFCFDDGTVLYEGERQRELGRVLAARLMALDIESVFSIGTWDEPRDVSLSDRVRMANALQARRPTLFVSLHSNAISAGSSGPGQTGARGWSIWTSPGQTASDAAAAAIWETVSRLQAVFATGGLSMRADRGDGDVDYESGFYVLRQTAGPAVLIESGFHDNPHDATWLLDDANLLQLACYIAVGIHQWMRGAA